MIRIDRMSRIKKIKQASLFIRIIRYIVTIGVLILIVIFKTKTYM